MLGGRWRQRSCVGGWQLARCQTPGSVGLNLPGCLLGVRHLPDLPAVVLGEGLGILPGARLPGGVGLNLPACLLGVRHPPVVVLVEGLGLLPGV